MAEIRYKGVVRNGVIVPIGEFPLPDGTVVDITVAEDEAWAMMSHPAFAEDRESEDDSVYDNWRRLFGTSGVPCC